MTSSGRDPGSSWALSVALAAGVLHAGFSLYWGGGGTWLLWSLGSGLVEAFRGREWILLPVGAFKLAAAVAPVLLARAQWPLRGLSRTVCWSGAGLLVLWGGVNTVVGNLVLTGLIRPADGYDRPGMLGHAYLWDPLFVVWGLALATGLLSTAPRWKWSGHPARFGSREGTPAAPPGMTSPSGRHRKPE